MSGISESLDSHVVEFADWVRDASQPYQCIRLWAPRLIQMGVTWDTFRRDENSVVKDFIDNGIPVVAAKDIYCLASTKFQERRKSPLAIFWDLTASSIPDDASGQAIVRHLKSKLSLYYEERIQIKAYCTALELGLLSGEKYLELLYSGVHLVYCPHDGPEGVITRMMIADALDFALSHVDGATFCFITSAEVCDPLIFSVLHCRSKFRIILMSQYFDEPLPYTARVVRVDCSSINVNRGVRERLEQQLETTIANSTGMATNDKANLYSERTTGMSQCGNASVVMDAKEGEVEETIENKSPPTNRSYVIKSTSMMLETHQENRTNNENLAECVAPVVVDSRESYPVTDCVPSTYNLTDAEFVVEIRSCTKENDVVLQNGESTAAATRSESLFKSTEFPKVQNQLLEESLVQTHETTDLSSRIKKLEIEGTGENGGGSVTDPSPRIEDERAEEAQLLVDLIKNEQPLPSEATTTVDQQDTSASSEGSVSFTQSRGEFTPNPLSGEASSALLSDEYCVDMDRSDSKSTDRSRHELLVEPQSRAQKESAEVCLDRCAANARRLCDDRTSCVANAGDSTVRPGAKLDCPKISTEAISSTEQELWRQRVELMRGYFNTKAIGDIDGELSALKTKVANHLRTFFPGVFPDRVSIQQFLRRAIENKVVRQSGNGPNMVLHYRIPIQTTIKTAFSTAGARSYRDALVQDPETQVSGLVNHIPTPKKLMSQFNKTSSDRSLLNAAMRSGSNHFDGQSYYALKSLVGSTLRTSFPNRFPDRMSVKQFLARSIQIGVVEESGRGATKILKIPARNADSATTESGASSTSPVTVSATLPANFKDPLPEKVKHASTVKPYVILIPWKEYLPVYSFPKNTYIYWCGEWLYLMTSIINRAQQAVVDKPWLRKASVLNWPMLINKNETVLA